MRHEKVTRILAFVFNGVGTYYLLTGVNNSQITGIVAVLLLMCLTNFLDGVAIGSTRRNNKNKK